MEHAEYRCCRLCPRECGANRIRGERGVCGMGAVPAAARAALHFWEEPCISGENGSGAVFFSGCPMECVYCQNQEISRENRGREIREEQLSEIFLRLQEQGAHNINLVTAVHFLPSAAEALRRSKENGLHIPVVYNSSGYERPESLRMLEGLVDIWLPDLKYLDEETALRYSGCRDYPSLAKGAIAEMADMAGMPVFDGQGLMKRGVIVRHLVLPGRTREAKSVIRYLYETYGDRIYLSILNQYTPMPGVEMRFPELGRKLTEEEYERVLRFAQRLGVSQGYRQEGGTVGESFIPAFDLEGLSDITDKEELTDDDL